MSEQIAGETRFESSYSAELTASPHIHRRFYRIGREFFEWSCRGESARMAVHGAISPEY